MKANLGQVLGKVALGALLAGSLLAAAGCGRGPTGPTGPTGAQGPAGVSLIKEYTGTITTAGDFNVDVPEILGRRSTTYVEAYWALPASPDVWTPMSDGWTAPLDPPTTSRTMTVSWTFGKVGLWGFKASDIYLIRVFQNN
jgi:hypothetical protein